MATTSQANTKKLQAYRDRVTKAREWRKNEGFDELWRDLVKMYRGKLNPKMGDDMDVINVNVAFSLINTVAPAVAVNWPEITVNACYPEHEDNALVAEHVLNYWWRHYDLRRPVRLAAQDYLAIGHGWLKTGWRYVEENVFLTDEELQRQELVNEAETFEQDGVEGETPVVAQSEVRVVEDRPFLERVSPLDVYMDPESKQYDNIRWIAQRIVKDFDIVKRDRRYKAAGRKGLVADGYNAIYDVYEDNQIDPPERDDVLRCIVWEFYDLQTGMMCVFPESGTDFLIEPTPMPYKFGHPFVAMRNYEVPDQLYPMGELEAIHDLQVELDKTRSQLMSHRRKFAEKIFIDPRGLTDEGKANLHNPDAGTYVEINGSIPIGQIAQTVQLTMVPPELYKMSEQIISDIEYVSAVSAYQRGVLTDGGAGTATEANILKDAANGRVADKLAHVEWVISQCARNMLMLGQQYMSEPQAARILGQNGAPLWFYFEPGFIQGEFDLEVVAGSTTPKDQNQRRQQVGQMLQTLGPFIGQFIDPQAFIPWVIKMMFDEKQPERFMIPPPPVDPMTGMPMGPGGPPPDGGMGGPPGMGGGPSGPMPMPTPPGTPDAQAPGWDPNMQGNQMAAMAGQAPF